MLTSKPHTQIKLVFVVAILLLAAVMRLNHITTADYSFDEANLSHRALDLVSGKQIPTQGLLSSQGVHHHNDTIMGSTFRRCRVARKADYHFF